MPQPVYELHYSTLFHLINLVTFVFEAKNKLLKDLSSSDSFYGDKEIVDVSGQNLALDLKMKRED